MKRRLSLLVVPSSVLAISCFSTLHTSPLFAQQQNSISLPIIDMPMTQERLNISNNQNTLLNNQMQVQPQSISPMNPALETGAKQIRINRTLWSDPNAIWSTEPSGRSCAINSTNRADQLTNVNFCDNSQ